MRFFLAFMKLAYMNRSYSRKEFALIPQLVLLLLFSIASGCSGTSGGGAVSIASPFNNPIRDKFVTDLYAAAKQRQATQLNSMRDAAAQAHASPDPALGLALYAIDPVAHESDFVDAYPTDAVGVQLDYGPRLERSGIAPSSYIFPFLFPIRSLGAIAAKGNSLALTKLIQAYSVSKEPMANAYAEEIARVGALLPTQTLTQIAALPLSQQLDLTALMQWCSNKPSILTVTPANSPEVNVQNEIRQRLAACPPTPQPQKTKPPHRKPKHKAKAKHGKPQHGKGKAAAKHPASKRTAHPKK